MGIPGGMMPGMDGGYGDAMGEGSDGGEGMGMGPMGPSTPGDADDGGFPGFGGAAGGTQLKDSSPWDLDVELYGIIYIYNPVDTEKIGKKLVPVTGDGSTMTEAGG